MRDQSPQEKGFALVTALWAALILGLISSAVILAGRTSFRIERTALIQSREQAAAQGILNIVELRLLGSGATKLPLYGKPIRVTYDSYDAEVELQDQAGLVDLNTAPPGLLMLTLTAVGDLDPLTAQNVTNCILDWRERGAERRPNGAKADDYAASGHAYGPRQAPFESVPELQLVKGITPVLYKVIEPFLTVYSQKPFIDQNVAPARVLSKILHWDEEKVVDTIEFRDETQREITSPVINIGSRSIAIRIKVVGERKISILTGAVIRLTGNPTDPIWTYRSD